MKTPRFDSPAETTCSRTPSPSMSIVKIEVGIDQGCKPVIKGVLILVPLIVRKEIFPSTVEGLLSLIPGIGVISSRTPSLSKSAIVEFNIET